MKPLPPAPASGSGAGKQSAPRPASPPVPPLPAARAEGASPALRSPFRSAAAPPKQQVVGWTYFTFLAATIERARNVSLASAAALDDAKKAAAVSVDRQPRHGQLDETVIQGWLDGYESCVGLSPRQLEQLLSRVRDDASRAEAAHDTRVVYWTALAKGVEWICAVVSAALKARGEPTICAVTIESALEAQAILSQPAPSA